ncbi:ABC transporter permease [Moorella naiadis]|uniref:ABC transporter permease n=1 Tax=Moorella naiadis (nom. illeg.) TaxID=3093670 RepID=UPI003D9CA541
MMDKVSVTNKNGSNYMSNPISTNRLLNKIGDLWTLGVLLLIVIIFACIEQNFFTSAYWLSTFVYLSEMLLLAVGETFVIITGGIDLSLGAIEGFVCVITALFIKALIPVVGVTPAIVLGILLGLLIGIFVGWVNGLIITKMRITPFITTLAMMGILTGFTFIFSGGTDVIGLPSEMTKVGNFVTLGILGFPVIVSWFITIVLYLVLSQTRFGVHTYAIGSNVEAARKAGINVNRHLIKIYTLAGSLAAISGILILLRYGTASPLTGSNIVLNAVAAVVIGGTSLMGGTGNLLNSFIGATIIAVLITGLVLINVEPFWQMVAIGVIIIIAVYIDQIRVKNK